MLEKYVGEYNTRLEETVAAVRKKLEILPHDTDLSKLSSESLLDQLAQQIADLNSGTGENGAPRKSGNGIPKKSKAKKIKHTRNQEQTSLLAQAHTSWFTKSVR